MNKQKRVWCSPFGPSGYMLLDQREQLKASGLSLLPLHSSICLTNSGTRGRLFIVSEKNFVPFRVSKACHWGSNLWILFIPIRPIVVP